jgi:ammonia channel protein AmtB
VALLLALVLVVGPLPAVFAFTTGYLAISKHSSLIRAVAYAFACVSVLYGLFGYTLGVQLNRGLISGMLANFVDF